MNPNENNNRKQKGKGAEKDSNAPAAENASSSGISSLQSTSDTQGLGTPQYTDHSRDHNDQSHQIAPVHRRPNFPEALFAILSNETLSSIISWLPHGRSFTILKKDLFEREVLPQYYRHNNLSSFFRQLSAYGFLRTRKESSTNRTYYHPYFLRALPHLLPSVTRSKNASERAMHREPVSESYFFQSTLRPIPTEFDMNDPASRAIAAINASIRSRNVDANDLEQSFAHGSNDAADSSNAPDNSAECATASASAASISLHPPGLQGQQFNSQFATTQSDPRQVYLPQPQLPPIPSLQPSALAPVPLIGQNIAALQSQMNPQNQNAAAPLPQPQPLSTIHQPTANLQNLTQALQNQQGQTLTNQYPVQHQQHAADLQSLFLAYQAQMNNAGASSVQLPQQLIPTMHQPDNMTRTSNNIIMPPQLPALPNNENEYTAETLQNLVHLIIAYYQAQMNANSSG